MFLKDLFKSLVMASIFLATCSAWGGEISVPAEAKNKIIGVRVQDLVDNYPSLVPGLANFNEALKKHPEDFFTQNKIEVLHDVFLDRLPEIEGGVVKLSVVGFVRYKKDVLNFERLKVTYNQGAKSHEEFHGEIVDIFSSKDMIFKASVGLIDRKLIIDDEAKAIKLVFPIGVGSFDEGVMNEGRISLVTPRFQNGFIDQRAVISKRVKPRYFDGKPFIRILKGHDIEKDMTAIGFHIEINDGFVRGFDSHGCMRLREMDLMAFHDLIMFNNEQQMPITVTYKTMDPADHPAGKRNSTYKSILNKGTAEAPFFIYDRDNLVQMTFKEGAQSLLTKLIDDPRDDYYDLFNYDTATQMNEQDLRRKNDCDARVMRGELTTDKKKYQECMDEGKRKDTLKDKIYRKFMGIDDYVVNTDLF